MLIFYEPASKKLSTANTKTEAVLKNKVVIMKTRDFERKFEDEVLTLSYKTWNKNNSFQGGEDIMDFGCSALGRDRKCDIF